LDSRLHTFATFAADPNLSRTAKRLHLSQPAVHAQLRGLAEDLGVTLYQRAGRSLALTAEGIEVAAFARDAAAREDELRARLRGEEANAPIIVAAGAGAIVHLLAPALRSFAKKRQIEVLTADANQAIALVKSGAAHIGVGVTAVPPLDLESHTIASADQVLVMRHDDALANTRNLRLSDLADHPLILPPAGGPQRVALDTAFASKRVSVHAIAVARGWDVVLRLVEVGIGVGIVNSTCVVPRTLVTRPLRELPRVTYRGFTRPRPRDAVRELVRALGPA
jgi:DNA-binding transcriptional LysR family regulator